MDCKFEALADGVSRTALPLALHGRRSSCRWASNNIMEIIEWPIDDSFGR